MPKSHWRVSDRRWTYAEYSPRLAHFFEEGDRYSYCGRILRESTSHSQQPDRDCMLCVLALVFDGRARVILPR